MKTTTIRRRRRSEEAQQQQHQQQQQTEERRRRSRCFLFHAVQARFLLVGLAVAAAAAAEHLPRQHVVLRRHLQTGHPAFVVGALGRATTTTTTTTTMGSSAIPRTSIFTKENDRDGPSHDASVFAQEAANRVEEYLFRQEHDYHKKENQNHHHYHHQDSFVGKTTTSSTTSSTSTSLFPTNTLQWTGEWKESPNGALHLRYQQVFPLLEKEEQQQQLLFLEKHGHENLFHNHQTTATPLTVEGGNLVIHTDAEGNVMGFNGEYVDCTAVLLHASKHETTIMSSDTAMRRALNDEFANNKNNGVMRNVVTSWTTPELALVVAEDDLTCCLAYKSTVEYYHQQQQPGEDGDDEDADEKGRLVLLRDIVYANVYNAKICARDPLVTWQRSRQQQQPPRQSDNNHNNRNHKKNHDYEHNLQPQQLQQQQPPMPKDGSNLNSPPLSSSAFLRRQSARKKNHRTRQLQQENLPNTTTTNNNNKNNNHGGRPNAIISTYFCVPIELNNTMNATNDIDSEDDEESKIRDDRPAQGNCTLVSTSPHPVATDVEAVNYAHNYALATFDYYWDFHGLYSLNGRGYELISYVLSEGFELANAFWNGFQMTYGYGNSRFLPLSQAADVVAHELTHGVTQFSSRLLYRNESGALNEAMSDIFGALVDRQVGARGEDVWMIGEDIMRYGTAIRDMGNPAANGHRDYYPERYIGEQNNGGVHWNSGIANLAFKLFVTGGSHPRGVTNVTVQGLIEIFNGDEDSAFALAGQIFYCANSECLTRHSTFDDARYCTAIICGSTGIPQDALVIQSLHSAWYAVGVGEDPSGTTFSPTSSPSSGKFSTAAPTPVFDKETFTETPSDHATSRPSATAAPSRPTTEPSFISPTHIPTNLPIQEPTETPSNEPSQSPSFVPTALPTVSPTKFPTAFPTNTPTELPTMDPTESPVSTPTNLPTRKPSGTSFPRPTDLPFSTTFPQTLTPTAGPSTLAPSQATSQTRQDITAMPTLQPHSPTQEPTGSRPDGGVFDKPHTDAPSPNIGEESSSTIFPSASPTLLRKTHVPSAVPAEADPSTSLPAPSPSPSVQKDAEAPSLAKTRAPTSIDEATSAPSIERPSPVGTLPPSVFNGNSSAPSPTAIGSVEFAERGNDDEKRNVPWQWVMIWGAAAALGASLVIALRNRLRK